MRWVERAAHPYALIGKDVELGEDVVVEPFCIIEGNVSIGGKSLIRAYTRIQGNVTIGSGFQTGNNALIKGDDIRIGNDVRIGSYSSVEGPVATIGDETIIHGRCEMSCATVGRRCRMYLGSVLSDTRRPPEGPVDPPVMEDDSILYIYALVMAGVTVGKGARVAAQATVLRDVRPWHLLKRSGEQAPLSP